MATEEIEELRLLYNPEEAIFDVRDKLDQLRDVNSQLNAGLEKRHESLKDAMGKIGQLGSNLKQFHATLTKIQNQVEVNRGRLLDLDKEYDRLQRERDNINTEFHFLSSPETWADLASGRINASLKDVETEKNLTDYTRDDLFEQLDNLDRIKRRLSDKSSEAKEQWDMYKDDIKKNRQEKKSYLDEINDVNNLSVSRFNNILKYGRHGLGLKERESINNAVKTIGLDLDLRTEREKYEDSQIFSTDLEDEIDQMLRMRENMWEQNTAMMEDIYALQDQEETIIPLKKSTKHTDLPTRDITLHKISGTPEEEEGEEANVGEEVEDFGGGTFLHKCVRHTDLSQLFNKPEKSGPSQNWVFTSQDTHIDAGNDQIDLDSATGRISNDGGSATLPPGGASGGQDEPPPDPKDPEDKGKKNKKEEKPEQKKMEKMDALKMKIGPSTTPAATARPALNTGMENAAMSDLMVSKIRGRAGTPTISTKLKEAEGVGGPPPPALRSTALGKQSSEKYHQPTTSRRSKRH